MPKYPKMQKFKSNKIPKGLSAATFHKGHPLAMPSLLECAVGIRAYYKGTSLPAPCSKEREAEFFATIKEGGRKQIEAYLHDGESLSNTIAILKGQLDQMEAGLCKHQGSNVGVRMYVEDMYRWCAAAVEGVLTGKEATIMWWMNIASLLELKVIENDDMNGWLGISC
jgi:hypothetical protein